VALNEEAAVCKVLEGLNQVDMVSPSKIGKDDEACFELVYSGSCAPVRQCIRTSI